MSATRSARLVAVLAVAVALFVPATASANPHVVPPVGPLYDGLSAAWWKYALELPTDRNPLVDRTGAKCREGQSGPVFFLVGTLESGGVVRTQCRVPAGKALFFPLLNAFYAREGENTLEEVWQRFVRDFRITANTLHATVDGVAIRNLDPATTPYTACVGPRPHCFPSSFFLNLPEDNVFGAPGGRYGPTVADGYYLLLFPLKPGRHTITFGGTGSSSGASFSQNITYHLRVG